MSDGFTFERLDVYPVALDFVTVADVVAKELPRGRGYLADQLRRASTSVVLNIAEGAGEFAAPEKARFYRMALRSCTECAAVVEVAHRLDAVAQPGYAKARELLVRLVSMLTRMVQRQQARAGEGLP